MRAMRSSGPKGRGHVALTFWTSVSTCVSRSFQLFSTSAVISSSGRSGGMTTSVTGPGWPDGGGAPAPPSASAAAPAAASAPPVRGTPGRNCVAGSHQGCCSCGSSRMLSSLSYEGSPLARSSAASAEGAASSPTASSEEEAPRSADPPTAPAGAARGRYPSSSSESKEGCRACTAALAAAATAAASAACAAAACAAASACSARCCGVSAALGAAPSAPASSDCWSSACWACNAVPPAAPVSATASCATVL